MCAALASAKACTYENTDLIILAALDELANVGGCMALNYLLKPHFHKVQYYLTSTGPLDVPRENSRL